MTDFLKAVNKSSIYRKTILVAAVLILASFADGQSQGIAEQKTAEEIRALDSEWLTAYDRGDEQSIRKIFAEEATMIHSDGRVTVKTDELKNVKGPIPPELKASWRVEQVNVRVYEKTAVSSGIAIQEGLFANQQFARKYRYTNVYVQRKKQWQLVSAQYSKITQ